MNSLNSIATAFCHSFYNKELIGGNTAISKLTAAEAYEVQDLVTKKRIEKGEHVVGYKVGCTSNAIQAKFGIHEPINGRLFQPHILDSKTTIDYSNYVNCAI